MVMLLAIGSPPGRRLRVLARFGAPNCSHLLWTAALTPWRLAREPVSLSTSVVVTAIALLLVRLRAVTLTDFRSFRLAAGLPLFLAVVAIVFESTATGLGGRRTRGRLLVASMAPLIPGLILLFALIAYLSPLGLWYSFWTSSIFRVAFLTIVLAMVIWTMYLTLAVRPDGWLGRVAGTLAATGAGLITLTALLPDWIDVRALWIAH